MVMNIRTLIFKINKSCDDLDFIEARRLIEFNIIKLSESVYYKLLNENAKVLVKHILKEQTNKDYPPLTRLDRLKINNINLFCSDFDISMLKRALKDSIDLIQRPDVEQLLNNDAKIVLKTMGAFLEGNQVRL